MGMRPDRSEARSVGSRSASTDRVSEVGKRRRRRQSDVARSDDRDGPRFPTAGAHGLGCGAGCMTGTSRARPSRQSGRAGRPPRRSAMLSSTELVGRGAMIGGSRSAVAIGFTRSGSAPTSARGPHARIPTRSSSPQLVTWKIPGRRSSPNVTIAGARSAVNVGRTVLVVDEAKLPSPLGQAQRRAHHVGAVGPADPAGPHDRASPGGTRARPPASMPRRPTPGWVVPLPVGPGRGAVEDVVRRDVDHVRPDRPRPPRPRFGSRCALTA